MHTAQHIDQGQQEVCWVVSTLNSGDKREQLVIKGSTEGLCWSRQAEIVVEQERVCWRQSFRIRQLVVYRHCEGYSCTLEVSFVERGAASGRTSDIKRIALVVFFIVSITLIRWRSAVK